MIRKIEIESRVSDYNAKRKNEPTSVGGECAENTATLLPYHSLRIRRTLQKVEMYRKAAHGCDYFCAQLWFKRTLKAGLSCCMGNELRRVLGFVHRVTPDCAF